MSANSRYKTHRGREFNMSAFAEKNGDTKVVGNVSMNARGDIIDAKGNVKIPTQTISRMAADIKNSESKHVSLKADEVISATPTKEPSPDLSVYDNERLVSKFDKIVERPAANIVSTRDVDTPDGPAVETEYDDGSIEIVLKEDI